MHKHEYTRICTQHTHTHIHTHIHMYIWIYVYMYIPCAHRFLSSFWPSIDQAILCKKLKDMGVDGYYLSWIKDYLSDRKHFVAYGGSWSNLADVPSGVVQGSCVGPCFFTLFINDMCKVLRQARSSLFANDFKMVGDVSTTECQELMQADVQAVADWSVVNKLPINLDKSVVLHYGRTNMRTQYKLNGQKLTAAETCNDLGLLRSHNFSYEEHARNVALKSARLSGSSLARESRTS